MNTTVNAHTNATQITCLSAAELIGRLVINSHGAEFVVVDLELDAHTGQILIGLDEIDLDTGHLAGAPCGLYDLKGWTIAHRVPHLH